ncbi:MAG: MoaD/ThiS family protein [Anaerolineae bacterium]|jgi:molybdopterin converting factor small subunit
MNITLKLFGTFQHRLPEGRKGQACDIGVADGASVRDVLDPLDVPFDGTVILVNGRTAGPDRVLKEGDVVAAFPALAGG